MSLRLPRRQILFSLLICAAGSVNAQKPPAIAASFVKVEGAGAAVSGYLAKPAAGSGLPAVLLVPAVSDLQGAVLQAARDMAAHGFVALAVDYDPEHVSQESDLVQSVAEEQLSLRLIGSRRLAGAAEPTSGSAAHRCDRLGWSIGEGLEIGAARQNPLGGDDRKRAVRRSGKSACRTRGANVVGDQRLHGGTRPGVETSAGVGGAYRVAFAPAWNEIYKFLNEAAASDKTISARPRHLQTLWSRFATSCE